MSTSGDDNDENDDNDNKNIKNNKNQKSNLHDFPLARILCESQLSVTKRGSDMPK